MDHLFLHCTMTWTLQNRLFQEVDFPWDPPRDAANMMLKVSEVWKTECFDWSHACSSLGDLSNGNLRILEDNWRPFEFFWNAV